MANKTISELPDFRSKKLLREAMDRGVALTQGTITDASDIMIVGLADVIFEMQENLIAIYLRNS